MGVSDMASKKPGNIDKMSVSTSNRVRKKPENIKKMDVSNRVNKKIGNIDKKMDVSDRVS